MDKYKVSVIVPAYNTEKLIGRCLDSILNQTLGGIQIIVINDGSTDKTEAICRTYAQNNDCIRVISKENEGQGIARNVGIQNAEGCFVGFVDADDYVEPEMYERLYDSAVATDSEWAYSYFANEGYLIDDRIKSHSSGKLIDTKAEKYLFKGMLLGGMPDEDQDGFLGISVCRSIFKLHTINKHNIRFLLEREVNSEDILFNLDYLNVCWRLCTVDFNGYHYCNDNAISFSKRPTPNRLKMFKQLYIELQNRVNNTEEEMRIQRRILANIRVIMVEKARWCTVHNYRKTKKEIMDVLNDEMVVSLLMLYPTKSLPILQSIYFTLMKKKLPALIVLFAKMRYLLIK